MYQLMPWKHTHMMPVHFLNNSRNFLALDPLKGRLRPLMETIMLHITLQTTMMKSSVNLSLMTLKFSPMISHHPGRSANAILCQRG